MGLQRTAGNRATGHLLTLQRLKGDANRYARDKGLPEGNAASYEAVRQFVGDPDNDRKHRLGLLATWNIGQRVWHIPTPGDLKADREPVPKRPEKRKQSGGGSDDEDSGSEGDGDISYSSADDQAMEESEFRDRRGELSDDAKGEFKKRQLDVDQYRNRTLRFTFKESGYGATSAAKSTFVFSKGAKDTRYATLMPKLSKLVKSDKVAADLMLKGLLDMPAFHAALADYGDAADRNTIQQFLALLFNEILGRSTSNLIEIVAMLLHTVKKDDDQLRRRFFDRGLFIPNAGEHKGFGGSKLSKIGSGQRTVKLGDLDAALQNVVKANQQLYQSLFEHSGEESFEAFMEQLKRLVERFADNFTEHVSVQFEK